MRTCVRVHAKYLRQDSVEALTGVDASFITGPYILHQISHRRVRVRCKQIPWAPNSSDGRLTLGSVSRWRFDICTTSPPSVTITIAVAISQALATTIATTMPPKKPPPAPPFAQDERVLCFHMSLLYEAKILDVRPQTASADDKAGPSSSAAGPRWEFKIHYKGWKSTWDDWVLQDRVRKFTNENKQIAAQLLSHWKEQQSGVKSAKGAAAAGKKVALGGPRGGGPFIGSDQGSARGSEERSTGAGPMPVGGSHTVLQGGRGGHRRPKEFNLEQVSARSSRGLSALSPLATCVFSPFVSRCVPCPLPGCRWP